MSYEFYIVDVFTDQKYSGNQLAVFTEADDIPEEDLQKIALEMNYSETTFIYSSSERNRFKTRIFTPLAEVPFAGHPTLGTAWVIQNILQVENANFTNESSLILDLPIGDIPVKFKEDGSLWMKQLNPVFGKTVSHDEAAKVLGLGFEELDLSFPVQTVSTGLPFALIPLKSLDAIKSINLNRTLEKGFLSQLEAMFTFVFTRETYSKEHQINARMFAEEIGVPEDPATGSANGCLAGYMSKYSYLGSSDVDCIVEQGYEINRPSHLYLKASKVNDENISVDVGGKVVLVAKGELF